MLKILGWEYELQKNFGRCLWEGCKVVRALTQEICLVILHLTPFMTCAVAHHNEQSAKHEYTDTGQVVTTK
jgi:hypothetical protein